MSAKHDSNPLPDSRQLTLFDAQFDSRIRRVEIDGVMYFSILDTFEYTGSSGSAKNPSKYWADAKKRLLKQGAEVLTEVLEHRFEGRGQRSTPIAAFRFFLRLAQVVEIAEWENVRRWMADVANERIEELNNPLIGIRNNERRLAFHRRQYLAAQIERGETIDSALRSLPDRIESIDVFKLLTNEIQKKIADPRYGQFVNAEYWAMFRAKADELQDMLNSKSIRDALPATQLQLIKSAELMIRDLVQQSDGMSMRDLLDAVEEIVAPMGAILRKACERAGVHHVTGKPLLTGGAK